jgi:hypothetical protein
VVAATTMRGHRKQSGSETSWDVYQVWTVRDGTVRAGAGVPKQGEAPRSRRAAGVGRSRLEEFGPAVNRLCAG